MATLSAEAYRLLVTAFDLTSSQTQSLLSVFEASSTLTTMLNTFAASGGKLVYVPASQATFTSGNIAMNNPSITMGSLFKLNSTISQQDAFADATLLAHELGHATQPNGLFYLDQASNPIQAGELGLNAEGVALTQEYTVASELNTTLGSNYTMHSGAVVQASIAEATGGLSGGSEAFIDSAIAAGAQWAAGQPSSAGILILA